MQLIKVGLFGFYQSSDETCAEKEYEGFSATTLLETS